MSLKSCKKASKRNLNNTYLKIDKNTPGTRVGPGGRDRMLAVKSRKKGHFRVIFRDSQRSVTEPGPTPSPWSISHSYAKILGETNFHAREFP